MCEPDWEACCCLRGGRWKTGAQRFWHDGFQSEADAGGNIIPRRTSAPQQAGALYSAGCARGQVCVDCGAAAVGFALAASRDQLETSGRVTAAVRSSLWPISIAPIEDCGQGRGPEALLARRLVLGLILHRTPQGRGRHPQRGGQLGQGELGGSEPTAAFLDVVDGHGR